jgi:patatin-related protein
VGEIDALAAASGLDWVTRQAFLDRIMPAHVKRGTEEHVSLIDGSVLVNAPFAGAMRALPARPAQREVDRRFVYIDPTPEHVGNGRLEPHDKRPVSFFGAILGSLSAIPREQPIRDNLEQIQRQSREAARLRQIVAALRPQVEASVEKLFGHTLFLDRPNENRLAAWRRRAQQSAAEGAGYAYHGYAQAKVAGVVEQLAETISMATPEVGASVDAIVGTLRFELDRRGLLSLAAPGGGATADAIGFLKSHDLRYRIRRLRLIARRLSREWEDDETIPNDAIEAARDAIYKILALYFELEGSAPLGEDFPDLAARVIAEPGVVLDALAERRDLERIDAKAEALLSDALGAMPKPLRNRVLLAYLGFPYYDIATLPLARNEDLTEFEGVKIDRISPEDARSIRAGGTRATLRGTEFYNFGAFFSRAYRENDYLWGRLHGAERMIDLVFSTLPAEPKEGDVLAAKQAVFRAILEEERGRLQCDTELIERIEREIAR